ncbi:MAG: hypothetical protein ACO37D_08230, partial [Rhodothermales bacterium]
MTGFFSRRTLAVSALMALMLLVSGCSVFSTPEPEEPLGETGSFIQHDTPEQVIENLQASVAELNTLNYRRSLSEDFAFRPTATAQARESVFLSWSRSQEEQYFSAMVAAAALNQGHSLQLNDQSLTLLSESEFVLDATYVLSVNHRRAEVPTRVQGRLQYWQNTGLETAPSFTEQTNFFGEVDGRNGD